MLKLFVKMGCPYCKKVMDANHDGIGADMELLYITHEENAKTLVETGGKRQVPFLVDDEREGSMYESDDIIDYLGENYGT